MIFEIFEHVFEISKLVFGMKMGDSGGLFNEIYSVESFLYDFLFFVTFGGPFGGNFWVIENFENVLCWVPQTK